jgi:AcrR family transcriptional regulator
MERNSPSQKRSRDRLRKVVTAAKKELSENGYNTLSIKRVCAVAGVKPASVYRYWPDKTAILKSLMDEFEHTISGQMRVRMAENPSLEEFISYLLSDLQYYCSYDDWIMQALIGMRVEVNMHERYDQSLERLTEIVAHGLSSYFLFKDDASAQRIAKSIVYIVETFLMALGRNFLLGRSSKGLRAEFEDVLMNHINCRCANLRKR